jgi:hypothetical protein
LYCAGIEVALVESAAAEKTASLDALVSLLETLADAPLWRGDVHLSRLLLLATRLTGRVDLLNLEWIAPMLAGKALGMMALSGSTHLSVSAALCLADAWNITNSPPSPTLTALRLVELANAPEGGLLQRALHKLPEAAYVPTPFRTAHRDLRIAFPQPDLRSVLEPLLGEMLATTLSDAEEFEEPIPEPDQEVNTTAIAAPLPEETRVRPARKKDAESKKATEWTLVLEFSESRSQYAGLALALAQKQAGYTTLLDEDRSIVHRVLFRKSEMRRFWRLWEYVQGWNSTHVYLNGDELQKWQVWPWSQVFR